MTLDELSVVFSADTAPFEEAVGQIAALLDDAGAAADAAAAHFSSAGSLAGDGFAAGLLSSRPQVEAAASSLANAAAAALQDALDIHSPSRLTRRLGVFFDEGLVQGIREGQRSSLSAAADLGENALFSLETALDRVPVLPSLTAPAAQADWEEKALIQASEDTAASKPLRDIPLPSPSSPSPLSSIPSDPAPISITLPLEIDGYRLGVAAIEGINRVTQGTGRIELNL